MMLKPRTKEDKWGLTLKLCFDTISVEGLNSQFFSLISQLRRKDLFNHTLFDMSDQDACAQFKSANYSLTIRL